MGKTNRIILIIIVSLTVAVFIFFFSRYLLDLSREQTARSQTRGVFPDKIIFGSSAALTGHSGFLGSEYIRGAKAYFDEINSQGGVYGRTIELISYDDQYDPPRTVVNTRKLINEDRVFALFDYVGTPTSVKIIPIVEKERIPLVGLFTGANALREPIKEFIYNIRASYYEEVDTFIEGVVGVLKFKKIAVLYQNDAYGLDGLRGAELALEKFDLKPVATASYERGTLDIEAALKTIENSRAEAVVMIGTYSPMAKFIRSAKADGFKLLFQNVSFVGPEALAQDLGGEGDGVIVTQVVPPPDENSLLPGVQEYVTTSKKYFPDSMPSFGGLEGFVNAKVVVEALRLTGADPDRTKFIEALESIINFDAGLGVPISFAENKHQGLDKVFLTYIKNGKYVLFSDWTEAAPILLGHGIQQPTINNQ